MIKIYINTFILSLQNPSFPSQSDVAAYSSKHVYAELDAHAPAITSNSSPPGNMSGHYEVDEDYGDPYWDPSSMEDELRMQLQKLKVQEIPREDLQWVFLIAIVNLGSTCPMCKTLLWTVPDHKHELHILEDQTSVF